jgi:hypothetical protein
MTGNKMAGKKMTGKKMTGKKKATLLGAAFTLLATAAGGVGYLQDGKTALGSTMLTGVAVGCTVLAVRLRAQRRVGGAETTGDRSEPPGPS